MKPCEKKGNISALGIIFSAPSALVPNCNLSFCLSTWADKHYNRSIPLFLMIYNMANLQKIVVSLLLVLTASFVFLAQTSSAAKGPKITNKVGLCIDRTS